MPETKIIIVDDHTLFRVGLKSVITERMANVSILAEYGSGKELLVHLENNMVPNIILLDIIMQEISGIELVRIIKKHFPDIKILMISSEISTDTILELLNIGIDGYLSKFAVQEDLVSAISTIMQGGHFFGKYVSQILYDTYVLKENQKTTKNKFFGKINDRANELTSREKEVIEMLCKGLSVKDIAEAFCVSSRTIDNHKANIMRKLGFHNTVELVKYAVKERIIVL